MPKLKTHKGMKKRFKVSATGKVSHKRAGSSHLNSHKTQERQTNSPAPQGKHPQGVGRGAPRA
jgi:ribosomal protein L35